MVCGFPDMLFNFAWDGKFCRLLLILANSLDPDQTLIRAWSGSKLFDTLIVSWKNFLKKSFWKSYM